MKTDRFRERMLKGLERHNMSVAELSRRSGVSYDVINKVKRREGASTTAENAAAILAVVEGVDVANAAQEEQGAVSLVPVYAVAASAGSGALVVDEGIVSSVAFPPNYLGRLTRANPRNLAIISVKGDSMVPTLADDDLVMLDTSKIDLSYDGLFVLRDNGDGLLVKRVGRGSKRGRVMLISDNRDLYPAVEREAEEIEVLGKVIWVGRKV